MLLNVILRLIGPRRSDVRHDRGRRGEAVAARHLRGKGHRIIARNYDSPAGEIDLITTDGATICFIEVKSRTDESGKDADHTVYHHQRERIIRAARGLLRRGDPHNRPARFDVVTVYFPPTGRPVIEHFENAFAP
jgi:putative endonuclease